MRQDEPTFVDPPSVSPRPPSHVRQVEDLVGPSGRLEAILNTGWPDPHLSAVVCHPYPPAGGTMHTKAVYHTMKALTSLGIPVLRFNFRGVGLSAGTFDHGLGEQDDVRAAFDWLDKTYRSPLLFAGFSFGSFVGLRASCSDSRVVARIGLGLPVRADGRDYHYAFLDTCPGPMLFLSGEEDEFCPPELLRQIVGPAPDRQIVLVPGADHFFQGTPESSASKLGTMQDEIRSWITTQTLPRAPIAPTSPTL